MVTSTVRKRREFEEHEVLAKNIALKLLETSTLLRNVVVRALLDNLPIEVDIGDLKQTYRFISELSLNKIYVVECDGHYIPLDEIYGVLEVTVTAGKVSIFYTDRPSEDNPLVVVRFGILNYVYPPKNFPSYLFFKLNPRIKKMVDRVIEKYGISGEVLSHIVDIETVEDKLKSINVDKNILDMESVEETVNAYGIVAFGKGFAETFNYIESFYSREFEKPWEGYHLSLKINGENVFYTLVHGDKHVGLEVLLKYFVGRSELRLLGSAVARISSAVVESYLVFKALSRLRS